MRFLLHALIACCLLLHFPLPSQTLARLDPAPGQLVDIGGRRLYIDCQGAGSPTVIFEAGGGAYAIDWTLVQPRVAQKTRVCSYDRAGLGWSEPGPGDETIEPTVADLHALLEASNQHPPYVLVGASVGGAFIRAYQRTFPNEVAALVFSNSANRIGLNLKGKGGLIWNLTEDEIRSAYPLPASAKGSKPIIEGEPFHRLPPQLQALRLSFDQKQWEKFNPATTGPAATLSWRREFLREFDEVNGNESPVLGILPVVVISSSPVLGKSECLSHNTAAACLDFLSSNTVHITASGSGHEIHLYQPEVVVKAVLQAISSLRNRTSLTAVPQ